MLQWAKASRKRPSIYLTMLLTYSTLHWKRTIGHHEVESLFGAEQNNKVGATED